MAEKYVYSISGDTANGIVDTTRLKHEIEDSAIIIALDYINTNDDELDVWFKDTLSSGDETILDGIVAAHTGQPWGTELVKTIDDKQWTQQTSRPLGTTTNFSSQGDDISDITKVGDGQVTKMYHHVGDSAEQELFVDFNVKENKTYVHEGYLMWEGANFDTVCMATVPTLTSYTPGTNTFFNLYGGYLVVPAAGDGTIQIAPEDMRLIEIPISRDIGKRKVNGFWDADYSTETHLFSNIRPAVDQYGQPTGAYNMFGAMVPFATFARKILLVNDGFIRLQTSDTEEIGHGMRFLFQMNTNLEDGDHEWKAACIMTLHRQKTC